MVVKNKATKIYEFTDITSNIVKSHGVYLCERGS